MNSEDIKYFDGKFDTVHTALTDISVAAGRMDEQMDSLIGRDGRIPRIEKKVAVNTTWRNKVAAGIAIFGVGLGWLLKMFWSST